MNILMKSMAALALMTAPALAGGIAFEDRGSVSTPSFDVGRSIDWTSDFRDRVNDEKGPCTKKRVKAAGAWHCGFGEAIIAILKEKKDKAPKPRPEQPDPVDPVPTEPDPVVDPRPGEGIPTDPVEPNPTEPTEPGGGDFDPPSQVPIPAAGLLLLTGGGALYAIRRRRK